MKRLTFESDYIAGAHPEVLKRLTETNMEYVAPYGTDSYSASAAEKIRHACGTDDVDVFFLMGGTQTNSVVISALLSSFEGVIAADTGHIGCHEAGAIEYTGHKVLTVPGKLGKIDISKLKEFVQDFYADENHEHMVFPGMVYISHPTESGTLYTKSELEQISAICREFDMRLYLDGARLGYGVQSYCTDVSLSDIAAICDAFYIGGTKVGALCGEAVVFKKTVTPGRFMTIVKKHGAMLAKGRLLGVQFDALFTDNLYFRISRHAIEMAEFLKAILVEKGYRFAWESPTNQQFVILENEEMNKLSQKVGFGYWEKYDNNHTVVRFATSWSTTYKDIEEFKKIL